MDVVCTGFDFLSEFFCHEIKLKRFNYTPIYRDFHIPNLIINYHIITYRITSYDHCIIKFISNKRKKHLQKQEKHRLKQ